MFLMVQWTDIANLDIGDGLAECDANQCWPSEKFSDAYKRHQASMS